MFGHVEEGQIYIFYGKMGSGKTTNAVREILRFYKRGSPVWVNFPIEKLPPRKGGFSPIWREDDPAGILSMRHGLYVIDEAYMTLNSREWQALPKAVFTAFTHVRKLDMTVIIIAQSWMRIDKSIREVASIARQFQGGKLFGRMYDFVEYEVDELGDIIKHEPTEYESAHRGLTLVGKKVYEAFDTDYLFSDHPPLKRWISAVREGDGGERSSPPPSVATRPALADSPQSGGSRSWRERHLPTFSKLWAQARGGVSRSTHDDPTRA